MATAEEQDLEDRDIHRVIRALREVVQGWPAPALAHYSETPFRTLASCLLSLRTQDRTTLEASKRLFEVADTPEALVQLTPRKIERLIYPVSFYRVKAVTLREVSRDLIDRFGGGVPESMESLLSLKGVGRKTANIVVTLGFGKPGIAVDTHVHRIANRFGYVSTRYPDETEMRLREKLPRRYWIEINDLLVALGQNVCRPTSPICSSCALVRWCGRIGVERSR